MSQTLPEKVRWTTADIELLAADEWKRYEIAKLKLYSSQGVEEYWIVSRELQQVEDYRRENAMLKRAATYRAADIITSPILPGFECVVQQLFQQVGKV